MVNAFHFVTPKNLPYICYNLVRKLTDTNYRVIWKKKENFCLHKPTKIQRTEKTLISMFESWKIWPVWQHSLRPACIKIMPLTFIYSEKTYLIDISISSTPNSLYQVEVILGIFARYVRRRQRIHRSCPNRIITLYRPELLRILDDKSSFEEDSIPNSSIIFRSWYSFQLLDC